MEAITACGFETIAAEDLSFTKALIHILAIASTGPHITLGELHSRILNRLKCYTPTLWEVDHGVYTDANYSGLSMEHQSRRTPIYTVVCQASPTRSIILAPLGPLYPAPSSPLMEGSAEFSYEIPHEISQTEHMNIDGVCETSNTSPVGKPSSPRLLRPEDDNLVITIAAGLGNSSDKQAWLEWIRNAPDDAKDVHVKWGARQ